MADLAREAVRARLHPALDADRASDSGAEGDEEEAVGAHARTDPALGKPAGAHVVAEGHGDAQLRGEQVAQGYVAPAEVGRVGGDAPVGVDDAGDGDAGGGRGLAEPLGAQGAELGGEVEDALDDRVRPALLPVARRA